VRGTPTVSPPITFSFLVCKYGFSLSVLACSILDLDLAALQKLGFCVCVSLSPMHGQPRADQFIFSPLLIEISKLFNN
jgi:hypothetical protein